MKAEDMDELQKLSVYMHYYIKRVMLREHVDAFSETVLSQERKSDNYYKAEFLNHTHFYSIRDKEYFQFEKERYAIEEYDFIFRQKFLANKRKDEHKPVIKYLYSKKLHADMNINSFDEFKQQREIDYGTHVCKYSYLSEWYWRFKNEIKLV